MKKTILILFFTIGMISITACNNKDMTEYVTKKIYNDLMAKYTKIIIKYTDLHKKNQQLNIEINTIKKENQDLKFKLKKYENGFNSMYE